MASPVVLVCDESQDNSRLQMDILKQLASIHGNYMIVGDENQSIYAFRGADIHSFIDIAKEDKEVETILLEHNYRSSGNIVNISNGLIENNTERLEKVAYTRNEEGARVFLYESDDELRESEYVIEMIEGLVNTGEYNYNDFAVLYRTNFLGQSLSMSLSSAGIPHVVQQGANFYDREEVKTLVSYLRLIENPLDDIALEYTINRPGRRIGATTVTRLKVYAAGVELPLSSVLAHVEDIPKINKPTKKAILEYHQLIEKARQLSKETTSVAKILKYILVETNYMQQFDVSKSKDARSIMLIEELFSIAENFDARGVKVDEESQTILTQFLTETALYASPEEEDLGQVTLSTVHSSKGLEFPVVFIIGLQQGTFPSYLSSNNEELEEERRLMYVAMTRAEKLLFLSYNRFEYRSGQVHACQPSIFLDELPTEYLHPIGKNARRE